MPHTANTHNNWNGVYGRLSNNGVFPTVVTKIVLSSEQGRFGHPTQNRQVSVRECARAQGTSVDRVIIIFIPNHYPFLASYEVIS